MTAAATMPRAAGYDDRALDRDSGWFPLAVSPMPDEPGRALTNAAVSLAREAEDLGRWHDSIETSCNVVRRALWRFRGGPEGKATATYATSTRQILWAVAEIGAWDTWGPPPRINSAAGDKYFRKHRESLRRWLDRLQSAGIIRWRGARKGEWWWRIEIELLDVQVDPERVEAAELRLKGWNERRRRSRRGGTMPARDLTKAIGGCKMLTRRERQRRGIAHQVAKANARRRSPHSGDLRHLSEAGEPYGLFQEEKTEVDEQNERSAPLNRRGVRRRTRPGTPEAPSLRSRDGSRRPSHRDFGENAPRPGEIGEEEGGLLEEQPDREISRQGRSGPPVAGRDGESVRSPAWHVRQAQIAFAAPAGAFLDHRLLEAIVHGFHAQRYGAEEAAATTSWRPRVKRSDLEREIRRYERYSDRRPPGWPESGVAALLTFAEFQDPDFVRLAHRDEWGHAWSEDRRRLQRPDTLPGALKRLQRLGRQMAAISDTEEDVKRRHGRRRRGAERRLEERRAARTPSEGLGFSFRLRPTTRTILFFESVDDRRERIRDALLLADDDPTYYADLDAMEIALIAHEQSGRYRPEQGEPSPALQRLVRGAAMPTWWQPTAAPSAHDAWARVLATAADAGADRTTLDLWCEQLEAVALADGHLVLRGPDFIVRYAAERIGEGLQRAADAQDLTIHWQTANGHPLEPVPADRRERVIGADGRRMLAELYVRDVRRGRWNLG